MSALNQSGHVQHKTPCPLYSRKWTCSVHRHVRFVPIAHIYQSYSHTDCSSATARCFRRKRRISSRLSAGRMQLAKAPRASSVRLSFLASIQARTTRAA